MDSASLWKAWNLGSSSLARASRRLQKSSSSELSRGLPLGRSTSYRSISKTSTCMDKRLLEACPGERGPVMRLARRAFCRRGTERWGQRCPGAGRVGWRWQAGLGDSLESGSPGNEDSIAQVKESHANDMRWPYLAVVFLVLRPLGCRSGLEFERQLAVAWVRIVASYQAIQNGDRRWMIWGRQHVNPR